MGETHRKIIWTETGDISAYRIEYKIGAGGWQEVVASTVGTNNEYAWPGIPATINSEQVLVAVMDADGFFKIISRKRDTIMAGEYSVYPRDVEEVLYENSKVLEAAVVGISSKGSGQRVKAFVVPRPGTNLSKEELLELCRNRLDKYAVPWEIEFREELPKSFIGKVLRRMLVEE